MSEEALRKGIQVLIRAVTDGVSQDLNTLAQGFLGHGINFIGIRREKAVRIVVAVVFDESRAFGTQRSVEHDFDTADIQAVAIESGLRTLLQQPARFRTRPVNSVVNTL